MATEEEISHPVFATCYDRLPTEWFLEPHREYLVADLSGRVLDLGAGSGSLFPYVDAVDEDGTVELHAVEPDPHMRRRAEDRANELERSSKRGRSIEIRSARAEALPYDDGYFDVVLASVVFCTIGDPDGALDEVTRVLKPGGEFRFVEHVHADGWRGSAQDVLNPVWSRVGGGCQLNRETVERIVAHDGFEVLEIERLDTGIFPVTPFVRGRVRRRRESL